MSLARFVPADFPISGNKNVVFCSVTGENLSHIFFVFRKKGVRGVMGGQSDLPASALFKNVR